MSEAERDHGLHIVQRILTTTRYIAETGCDSKTIVDILDEAEYLVDILVRQDAAEFKLFLVHLGERFPEHFKHLHEDFDSALINSPVAGAA